MRPQRFSQRPQCERLEDRFAPSVQSGDIFVANYHSGNDKNGTIQPGIYGVRLNSDDQDSMQYPVAVNGLLGSTYAPFLNPDDLREDPSNASVLYVSDATAGDYGTGAIFKVLLASPYPTVTLLNESRSLVHPSELQWVTDSSNTTHLWVVYAGNTQSNLNQGYLVEMDLSGHVLYTIDTDQFACVTGLCRVPNDPNHLFVCDQGGNFHSGVGPGTIYEVDINPNDQNFGYYTKFLNPAWPMNRSRGGMYLIMHEQTYWNPCRT
jgi:hypothetical protein